jgi:hypothetical protein
MGDSSGDETGNRLRRSYYATAKYVDVFTRPSDTTGDTNRYLALAGALLPSHRLPLWQRKVQK